MQRATFVTRLSVSQVFARERLRNLDEASRVAFRTEEKSIFTLAAVLKMALVHRLHTILQSAAACPQRSRRGLYIEEVLTSRTVRRLQVRCARVIGLVVIDGVLGLVLRLLPIVRLKCGY